MSDEMMEGDMMEGEMMDEKSKLMEESASKKPTEAPEEESKKPFEDHELCCCCLCECSNEKTIDKSCCGCFPIKCGLITIGIFYVLLTIALFTELFYGLINENIHWWYVLVGIILMAPQIVGLCFWVFFFSKDEESTRGKLYVACMLLIISVSCVVIWNICYFQFLYKHDIVFAGADLVGYTTQ